MKKWTQTRDSWMKSMKKQKEEKRSGSSAKPSRLYLYHEQMGFMKKIIDSTTVQESIDDSVRTDEENRGGRQIDENEKNHTVHQPSSSGTQRKRKSETMHELDAKMLKFIDHQINIPKYTENRHLSFFKGLLPTMSSLNEDQTLEFQAGVISLLQNIKKSTPQYAHHGIQNQFLTPSPMQPNIQWPNYRYYPLPPQQPLNTVNQPIASPESVISQPVSVMSTTSQESEEYDFTELIN